MYNETREIFSKKNYSFYSRSYNLAGDNVWKPP